ncbi:MAG: 2-succinyl-5-enolpyruvyl-6-hydroxy-3-cyclohexene-1-carboxylic-acid synthase [Bacteroidota bacterium]
MIDQVLFDTAEVCYLKGIQNVILSPGSRNAPLTISFSRHPGLKIFSIVDERSAGFIALGMAQSSKTPSVICCTSGTALLNYLPAIAEAYYQQNPIIVISADRPPEWINQRDGQTIEQSRVTDNFTKGFFQMPVDLSHKDAAWEYTRKLNEAINLSNAYPKGPVHINIPFREPFYPSNDQKLSYSQDITIIESVIDSYSPVVPVGLIEAWKKYSNKLILIGQHEPDSTLKNQLVNLSKKEGIPIITDVISNLNHDVFIKYHDHYLGKLNPAILDTLKPGLLITGGKSIISKSLKHFLRRFKPEQHWHFEEGNQIADTYQSMTHRVNYPIKELIQNITGTKSPDTTQLKYLESWQKFERTYSNNLEKVRDEAFSEYVASYHIANSIPSEYSLHLANSMPVRYANLVRKNHPDIQVFCNRGTSGIDGTNGAAVGDALLKNGGVVLWTGDLSFFYDRNAFFHHHDLKNLRIIVINNQGGGIFRLIDGPKSLPELEGYFETRHNHSTKSMASEFGFEYHSADDLKSLEEGLDQLFNKKNNKKILEVFTEPSINETVYNKIKNLTYE